MKNLLVLSLTTASLLAASTAVAGPNCRGGCDRERNSQPEEVTYPVVAEQEAAEAKCPKKDKNGTDEEGVAVVAQDEEMQEGDRPQRRERAERRERGEGEEGDRPRRGGGDPLRALGLSDEQKEQVKEIFDASREEAQAVIEEAKAAAEAGEEVSRDAVREQMQAIREAARKNIYDNVLTQEQQAKMDEIRAEMEKRRAEMEARRAERGEEGDRPRREGGEEGDRPRRSREGDRPQRGGGDQGLDL